MTTQPPSVQTAPWPLVVDLDGTLIKTDLLLEAASAFAVRHPLRVWQLAGWTAAGRSTLKSRLASATQLDAAALPYNEALVERLRAEKASGRRIVLATASHRSQAEQVAAHLGVFDEVLATDADVNLKAERKRDALVARFGAGQFDYVGNDDADFPVWRTARKAMVVNGSARFVARVQALGNLGDVFSDARPPTGRSLTKAMRLHQWVKNLLVFVPLMAAHLYTDGPSVRDALLAFLAFGLMASSVYLFNDLVDVADDRHHARKRHRPFAAGDLGLLTGWVLSPMLLLAAFGIALTTLNLAFVGVLAAYFVLTVAYSLRLKQRAILDVLALAALYTIRIVAGAAAVDVAPSFWLLSFSAFIFLSLAFIKRFSELRAVQPRGGSGSGSSGDTNAALRGRGYYNDDLDIVSSMGAGAGYLSVLVLALYIQDAHTAELYANPRLIWLACPILLYWISRAWLIAHRGQMHDDPIVFAIKDRASWIMGACFVGVFGLAKLPL